MRFNISILSVFIFLSTCSLAQYKYDIGLKASSYDLERYQLETRLHLKSPYSLLVNYSYGSSGFLYSHPYTVISDSTFSETNGYLFTQSNTLKFGVQRKLRSLATNIFYVGATFGLGYEKHDLYTYIREYSYDTAPPSPNGTGSYELLASNGTNHMYGVLHSQLALSFGIDAPITKHFAINVEASLAGFHSNNLSSKYDYLYLVPSISGGLRYSFIKRE